MTRALLVAGLLAGFASIALAATNPYTIRGDTRIGAFKTKTALQLTDAVAVFGAASFMHKLDRTDCRAVWRYRGLSMLLLDLDQTGDPCINGVFVRGTMIGRAWHTLLGLRIGDPLAKLRRLYPGALQHLHEGPNTGWWLVPRRSCPETGSNPYPGLLARTIRRRVSAFVLQIGVCE
jgi:hypothetical protein